jgi:hypothetical protein
MSCYNDVGTATFNNSTLVPSLYSNGTQYYPFNYSQFLESLNRNISCGGPTYLRPDVGGSLLPWLYTIIEISIHLPVVLVRVARWDKVQVISLALAGFQICLTLLSYHSTRLSPDQVLVWMPLTLPLDAGSMLQLAVLIVEDVGYRNLYQGLAQMFQSKSSQPAYELCENTGKESNIALHQFELTPRDYEEKLRKTGDVNNTAKAFIAIGATVFFFIIVSLQIVGVVKAAQGSHTSQNLTVAWCSPIFELFTVAVSDSNCNFYPVTQNSGKGLGCIKLPALQQKNWLQITLAVGSISLIFEFCDFLILVMVHGKTRWRSIKMKRPWFTVSISIVTVKIFACPITNIE